MKFLTRRDFIKLGLNLFGAGIASKALKSIKQPVNSIPNIVVLVCDAMSARNLSIYGYARQTTPNLEKLAERALVYHRHYANGNFTSSGTSSLLTGLLPWTHRAINLSGVVSKKYEDHNLFHFLGDSVFKLAFTQNLWAQYLLDQFSPHIHTLLPPSKFGLFGSRSVSLKDAVVANHAFERMLYYNSSLLSSFVYGMFQQSKIKAKLDGDYPNGFPIGQYYDHPFKIGDLFDGLSELILELDREHSPFFTYLHIYPPHDPYVPSSDFAGRFDNDGMIPLEKRTHNLADGDSQSSLNIERNKYDAYIANLDSEIGRLFETLEARGVLDHTYFILTADHGEMFERGTDGHVTPMLYDPVIHIPLLIFAPDNHSRMDITTPTCNIDLMPTILNLAGREIPASAEGRILPGLGGTEDASRAIYTVEAKESSAHSPFTKATYSIIKGNYKLIHYEGYQHKYQNFYEFYDLDQDVEELKDKYSVSRFQTLIEDMKAELSAAIDKSNKDLYAD